MSRPRDVIEAEAAEWAIRLGGAPLNAAAERDLNGWLASDPSHGEALAKALSMWANLAALRHAPGNLAGHRHAARPARSWPQAAALAASLLLALLAGLVSWQGNPWLVLTADARTAPGETMVLMLDDGSRVDLAPASAVAVHYGDAERRVDLLAGKAYFAPVPLAQAGGRPFVVGAAGGTAQALGTQFTVDRRGDGAVAVTVAEHTVRVAAPSGESAVLSPAQSVAYGPDGRLGPVLAADVRHATAWRDGRLIFDRVPLSQVVEELNRYRRGRIVIASDQLGGRMVSGVFDTARLDDALDTIGQELGLDIAAVPPFVTVLY